MLKTDIQKVKKILGPKNVKKFYTLVPLDILTSFLEIISISLVIPFVITISDKQRVLNSEYSYLINETFNDYNSFIFYIGLLLVITLFISNTLSIYVQSKLIYLANLIGQETSQLHFKNYLNSNYDFHIKSNNTELSKVLISDVTLFTQNVLIAALKLISKFIFTIIIIISWIVVDYKVTFLIFISILFAYFIIYKSFKKTLSTNGSNIVVSNKNIYRVISEALNGIKETKFYRLEKYYENIFVSNSNKVATSTASSQVRSIIPKNIIEFFIFSGLIVLIYILNTNNNLLTNLPTISFFLYSGYRLLPAVQQIYSSIALIRANFQSVNEILKFANLAKPDFSKNSIFKDSFNSIDIQNITFGYSSSNIFLKNLSFKITKNQFICFLGESGSGKSSLIDLLLKLINPISGSLLINNEPYDIGVAKALFAYVPQDIYLSDTSISENIRLGDIENSINKEKLIHSCHLSGLSTFINSLENKYETKIGENGSLLSGGQRKRLGLARAIYSKKPILILDEVTSGLDKKTELAILDDLKLLSKEKLIILVTHNSNDLHYYDKIIDLESLK